MYIDPVNRQFGAWRVDDQANSSPAKFSLFFPDRSKDPHQYEARPDNTGYGVSGRTRSSAGAFPRARLQSRML